MEKQLTKQRPAYSLLELSKYFLKLGTWGFGGPVALVGYMHRDLVENKGWLTGEEYKEGLALAQLAPGLLAAQLGIYIGFVHYGLIGATLTGLAFVIPSFIHGCSAWYGLLALWGPGLDAGSVLWCWCSCDWYYCYERL